MALGKSKYIRRHEWRGFKYEGGKCKRLVLGLWTIDAFTLKLSARMDEVVDAARDAANKEDGR
jgi:hypothetical protein